MRYRGSRSRRSRARMRFRVVQAVMYWLALSIATGHVQEDLLEARAGGGEIRARGELGDGAVGDLLSAVHDDHARADLLDEMQQMGRHQNRRAAAAARDDRLAHPPDAQWVEARQRFVKKQD